MKIAHKFYSMILNPHYSCDNVVLMLPITTFKNYYINVYFYTTMMIQSQKNDNLDGEA